LEQDLELLRSSEPLGAEVLAVWMQKMDNNANDSSGYAMIHYPLIS
jgi:hypothetical protein